MKLSLRFATLLLLLAATTAVFASADNHKATMNISSPAQISGTDLAAGEYTIRWDGMGPTAEVKIFRDGKVVASTSARVLKVDQKAPQDGVVTKTINGVTTITRIQFEGKTYVLEVGDEAGGGAESGSSVK